MQKKHFSLSANPARVITGSFLGVIITGTLLLMLPLFWITTGVASVLFLILRVRGPLRLYPAQTWLRGGQKVGVYFSSVAMIFVLLVILFFMVQNFVRVA